MELAGDSAKFCVSDRTTKSFSESNDVADLQLMKTAAFHELQVDVRRAVERWKLERRPACSSLRLNRCAVRDSRLACA